MHDIAGIVLVMLLVGCSPKSTPAEFNSSVPAKSPGQEITAAYRYCLVEAQKSCSGASVKCTSYQRSFVKACMTTIGVPAENIELFLSR